MFIIFNLDIASFIVLMLFVEPNCFLTQELLGKLFLIPY